MITECCGIEIQDDQRYCPKCGQECRVEEKERKHDWVFYMNGTFCRRCNAQLGSGLPCK